MTRTDASPAPPSPGSAPAAGDLSLLADWGTTRLRLYLCDGSAPDRPRVLGGVTGPGVKLAGDFERVFLEHAARLPVPAGPVDVVITGMVGSNIGWRQTGYVPCPTNWDAYVAGGETFELDRYRITILPGTASSNEFGYRDVMRGEEVQVLGALRNGAVDAARHLFCLPGTHTKWVLVEQRSLNAFATSMQGELFDILCEKSVLVPRREFDTYRHAGIVPAAFDDGVRLLAQHAPLSFEQALFSVRCRHVSGDLPAADAVSFLSGIVVAADVRDVGNALRPRHSVERPVVVVGDPALAALYARAMDLFGVPTRLLDGDECTLRGLHACRQLRMREAGHAT